MESKTSGYDSNNQYYTKVEAPDTKKGFIRKPQKLDHFKTNFGIEQLPGQHSSNENLYQDSFQAIPYGVKFDEVVQDKTNVKTVQTVQVPGLSHEITYSANWVSQSNASSLYGDLKYSSAASATATFSFFGTSVGLAYYRATNSGDFKVELSSDGGSTYSLQKNFTQDASGPGYGNHIQFYENLPLAEYTIKITVLRAEQVIIEYLYYTTYMCVFPIYRNYQEAAATKTVADVAPGVFHQVGTWTDRVNTSVEAWGGLYSSTSTQDAYFDISVVGKKFWVCLLWATNGDATITPTIDGATTNVLATTFNTTCTNGYYPTWVRLDTGTLTDAAHTLKLLKASSTAGGQSMYICAIGAYSELASTTVSKSLICGEASYIVPIDDSGFSVSGAGWGATAENGYGVNRRYRRTTTDTNYIEFTTPNNTGLKAIYAYMLSSTDRGNISISLGGSSSMVRVQNLDTEGGTFTGLHLLYDSYIDGALHNKVLRITKDSGSNFDLQGLVFEIGDSTGTSYLWCKNKITETTDISGSSQEVAVSGTHRLDVYGICSDGIQHSAKPIVKTSWRYRAGNATTFWNLGVPLFLVANIKRVRLNSIYAALQSNQTYMSDTDDSNIGLQFMADSCTLGKSTGSNGGSFGIRLEFEPRYVI